MEPMIELRDLALDAPDGAPLVKGLDLVVPTGGNQLVLGPSGGGKTRLLKVIGGLERPSGGWVRVGGREIWPGDGAFGMAGRLGVGFAFASGGLLSNLSLYENVAMPLRFRGLPSAEIQVRARAALASVGLSRMAELRPHAVSVSGRKHANLARVMALDPELILLDDPLEGLDTADRATALGLIGDWAAHPGKTLLIALEDPAPFADLSAARLTLHPLPIPLETP